MENTGNYYVIRHLVLCTGLSERTIRSYIASGLLQGEKINGLWHFTPEQVEAFVRHPTVRPSILSKNHALVWDFLQDERKKESEICMVLDVPGAQRQALAEYFCDAICQSSRRKIRFAYDGVGQVSRVIVTGDAGEVCDLILRARQDLGLF